MMKAVVKQVLSGDTIVLRGRATNGPPPERQLSLAYVSAPRLGRKDEKGEAYAWESREYLRKLIVGKEVSFKVQYTTKNGREFGQVVLGLDQDVTQILVSLGLVKLRDERGKDDLEHLVQAEELAKASQVGIFSPFPVPVQDVKQTLDGDAKAYFDANKGKIVDAIVERVRDGSTVQVILLPSLQTITLQLSGIKAPTYRKDIPNQPDQIEPFGGEAKYFTESRLLQQDVKVILEGFSNNNFVGTVIHPNGNISEALVKEGFAKVVDWSITLVTGGPKNLREAEKSAKQRQVRIWKDYKPKADGGAGSGSGITSSGTQFVGKVVKIFNGESIAVTHNNVEYKLFLSSIRQPRQKEAAEAPYQGEAKEFLRSRLIGKKVHVHIDYTKPAEEGYEERVCASIKSDDVNINEAIVSKGLASIVRHRQDDENRASNYDQLLLAEDRAQKGKKGIYSGKDVPVPRISDASESLAKAKSFLSTFKRQGKISAVVEYVFNGSRFKLYVPKESAKLVFVLSGVRVGRVGKSPEEHEPFAQEALSYVSDKIFQHDVDVEIENVDKNGGFIGTLFLPSGENLSVLLLENGLGSLHGPSADQSIHVNQLYSAEKRAKAEHKNLWQHYDAEKERAALEEAKAATAAATAEQKETAAEKLTILPTEILGGNKFFAQTVGQSAHQLEKLMEEFAQFHKSAPAGSSAFVPKKNELVSAQFSQDKQWYRARIVQGYPNKSADVFFIDFGNSETVQAAALRPLPATFASLPAQANEYQLLGVLPPPAASDYEKEAVSALSALILGRELYVNVIQRVEKVGHVLAFDDKSIDVADSPNNVSQSINARIVELGLGVVEKKRERYLAPLISKLIASQEDAQSRRTNIWEYGDISSDDAREFGYSRRF